MLIVITFTEFTVLPLNAYIKARVVCYSVKRISPQMVELSVYIMIHLDI